MAGGERIKFNNKVVDWVDERMPIFTMMQREYGTFPTPKNFNYFWNFGAIAFFMLITMILSGFFLAMNFIPHEDHAFASIERIMRDVNWGWFMRYLHMNGASMFFIAVYIAISVYLLFIKRGPAAQAFFDLLLARPNAPRA